MSGTFHKVFNFELTLSVTSCFLKGVTKDSERGYGNIY